MTTYDVVPLRYLLESNFDVEEILSGFSCSIDGDVQIFLNDKAIDYEKRHLSRTYLLFNEEKRLFAYFSIAVSSIEAKNLVCSNTLKKKLNINKDGIIQSYLIGQVGRDSNSKKGLGNNALEEATDLIKQINSVIGCRVVRVDCKDEIKLVKYYEKRGFRIIGRNETSGLNILVKIIS